MKHNSIVTIAKKDDEKFLRNEVRAIDFSVVPLKELRSLVTRMRTSMKVAQGVGLSANQIGVSDRIFVAHVPDREGHMKFYTVINPTIVKKSKDMSLGEEGCLSVPNVYGMVSRPSRITIEGFDIRGQKIKINAWGLLARVFQHEIDHLNGKLFIDHCKEVYTYESERKRES